MVIQEGKIKILIFGRNGQIASCLLEKFNHEKEFEIFSYSSSQVNFADLKQLKNFLQNLNYIPNWIINAAAYTDVDKAEDEKELCDLINHQAVQIIANYCAENKVKLIHYSTEYIFDGTDSEPFKEDNIKNLKPLNFYGKTKLLSESAIISSGCWYLILRISWVFNEKGKNFFNKISDLAFEKEEISVVDDQVGSPTPASFVAENTIKIIKEVALGNSNKFMSGIYHLNNNKFISWYQFAVQIVESLKLAGENLKVKKITPVKSSEYKTRAVRPLNCRLDSQKLRNLIDL